MKGTIITQGWFKDDKTYCTREEERAKGRKKKSQQMW